MTELVSSKWTLKDSAIGDLNGDQRPDIALVLEYSDTVAEFREDSIENTGKPRILVVLLRNSNDRDYRVAVQNNTFILREGEGGMEPDPYGGISIHRGVLEIFFQFVRAELSYRFRFKSAAFNLIGATEGGRSGNTDESWDFNFSTGWTKHWWQETGDKKSPEHVKWKRMKPRAPIRLDAMKFRYQVQVFPDVSI